MSDSHSAKTPELSVRLGRLTLPNPILVASGTFGYAREMAGIVNLSRLGGIVPKTITPAPRVGNVPWRTVETTAGLLNSIGLDNDGLDAFLEFHLPYLASQSCPLIVSIAAASTREYAEMSASITAAGGAAAIELNISCPNVAHGVDFGTDPDQCHAVVKAVRDETDLPVFAKLTPNVTRIDEIAQAAEAASADGLSVMNTVLGIAIDWRRRRPMLGNGMGGLSGPAIKPIALRCVRQVAAAVSLPIIGIGGIATIDDVMEFLVAGATAVQIGTANFYDPTVSMRIIDQLTGGFVRVESRLGGGNRRDAGSVSLRRYRLSLKRKPHRCVFFPGFNPRADFTGATTSVRSASTSICRRGMKPIISLQTCMP